MCLWPRPPASLGHGARRGPGTLPQVPIFPLLLGTLSHCLGHSGPCAFAPPTSHTSGGCPRGSSDRGSQTGAPLSLPSPSGPSRSACPRSRRCFQIWHGSPAPSCPWAPLGTARLTPAPGRLARQAPGSQLWSPRALPSPAATSVAVLRAGTVTTGHLWACGLPGTRRCGLWHREPLGREGGKVGPWVCRRLSRASPGSAPLVPGHLDK